MALRCPACGKQNSDEAATACARCGADLAELEAILDYAAWHLIESSAQFRARDWETAFWHAEQSWKLRHSDAAARMAFLAAAAVGDTASALQWLPRAQGADQLSSEFRL